MSGSGQTRRFRDVRGMSGLPQNADISGPVGTSHLCHETDIPFAIGSADLSEGIHGLVGSERRCYYSLARVMERIYFTGPKCGKPRCSSATMR